MKFNGKTLIIKTEKRSGTKCITIIEQSHRGHNFADKPYGCKFNATNGITLKSFDAPENRLFKNTFYVRGRMKGYDNTLIRISNKNCKKVKKAIKEYNEHFSLKYLY